MNEMHMKVVSKWEEREDSFKITSPPLTLACLQMSFSGIQTTARHCENSMNKPLGEVW